MLYVIGLLVIAGILGLYYFCFKNLSRFKKHGIPHEKPLPLIGNMWPLFGFQSLAELTKSLYNLKPDAKYIGIYDTTNPIVMLRDPELIKFVTVKHFKSFMDHNQFVDETQDAIFNQMVFSLRGEKWRQVRGLLNPVFTSSKLKGMFKLAMEYSASFSNFLAQVPQNENRMLEAKDLFTRYASDIIAICVFGVTIDSMRDPDNKFYMNTKEMIIFTKTELLKIFIFRQLPWLARIIRLKFIREGIVNFFRDLIKTTIKARDERDTVRSDMLQLMMESRNDESKPNLTIDEMVSQAFVFFLGGFETSRNLQSLAAHEIAMNPDILETLQKEIDNVLEETNGQVTYEAINNMEYLDAVLHEALRMYPSIPILDRTCLKDFELPPTLPGMKPFTIKKGEGILVPVYALHHDTKYFENPEKFDPERFLGERRKESLNCGAFLPFGLGPRICLGYRFALLEAKILFFNLLARCDLTSSVKTTLPLKFTKNSYSLSAENDIWLNVVPRKNLHHSIAIPNEMCKT